MKIKLLIVLLVLCQPVYAGGWHKYLPGSRFTWEMCEIFPDLKWCKARA